MERKEIESAVEAILFASGEPMQLKRLCAALELARPAVERALKDLGDRYAFDRRGIRLVQMDDCWQLCSAPEYGDAVHRALEVRKPAKLSQPALEALTIIAYYQPTTRAYVDQIRGVDSSYTMSLLLNRDLIEECGRLQVPGRPRLYRTTKQFLRAFHLSSLEDLPELAEPSEGEDPLDPEADGQMRLGENGEIVSSEREEETE
ncbi:MAG: SMC-Scp complex subunit ScpB [Oscillibacter sp.]|jgi:segregation and condensation protein B|uniref:SMC-Scp complex subunit ScpB n=3 Tax=uncultured Oscillibacter sp. TaxID=876091 RepID=UPI00217246FB|nr:SMC-Scp complex subunit ScpB [uncultured Oscillibacter sp.]MCI9643720.1 SMC-Scp complex subunit ScpB [Oscillibacter sp.]